MLSFFTYSALTAMLNALPLTVRSSSLAGPWIPIIAAAPVAGNVIVALAPICARKPNGPGAKRL